MVTVSQENTWIVQPLRPNGDPDYESWLNQQLSSGVTAENNLALAILEIVGPVDENGKRLPDEFLRRIGCSLEFDPPNILAILNKHFEKQIKSEDKLSPSEIAGKVLTFEDTIRMAREFPLAPETVNWLDEWLDQNGVPLVALREASLKKNFYAPLIGHPLVNASLAFHVSVRNVCESLLVAAMLRLGRGEVREGILDQLAVIRIGRTLQTARGVLVQWKIGNDLEKWGLESLQQTVLRSNLNQTDLQWLDEQFKALPQRVSLNSDLINFDRVASLDAILFLGRYGFADLNYVPSSEERLLPLMTYDCEEVLKAVNQMFDELEGAFALTETSERIAVFQRYERKMLGLAADRKNHSPLFHLTTKSRGRAMGKLMQEFLCPDYMTLHHADVANTIRSELFRIALARQRYYLEKGNYPRIVSELVPQFLKEVPNDPTNGRPYFFSDDPTAEILFASTGENGILDSESTTSNQRNPHDDILVKIPLNTAEEWVVRVISDKLGGMTLKEVLELTKKITEERKQQKSREK